MLNSRDILTVNIVGNTRGGVVMGSSAPPSIHYGMANGHIVRDIHDDGDFPDGTFYIIELIYFYCWFRVHPSVNTLKLPGHTNFKRQFTVFLFIHKTGFFLFSEIITQLSIDCQNFSYNCSHGLDFSGAH